MTNKITNNKWFKLLVKYLFLFVFGSIVYAGIEIGFRGYTYLLMGIVGGIAFILIGLVNEVLDWDFPLILQMIIGGLIVTLLELITGIALSNFGIQMWDYSGQWLNYKGVICPLFSFIWCFISLLGIVVDDFIRWDFFGEEKPRYRWF